MTLKPIIGSEIFSVTTKGTSISENDDCSLKLKTVTPSTSTIVSFAAFKLIGTCPSVNSDIGCISNLLKFFSSHDFVIRLTMLPVSHNPELWIPFRKHLITGLLPTSLTNFLDCLLFNCLFWLQLKFENNFERSLSSKLLI